VLALLGRIPSAIGYQPTLAVLTAGSTITWHIPGGPEQGNTGENGLLNFQENTCTLALV
jgi:hypothetical protein